MEIGVYSFAEITPGEHPARRINELIEEIVLADEVGLDVFGVGEHHRPDFSVSAPAVVLAAAAARTKRIRLTSAVSVLSSDDPIRVFQQFATLDLISGGRAEIMAGRGSFIESFPLFGYDLEDYDELFDEKLEMLLKIRESEQVHWRGNLRAPLKGQGVYPRPIQDPLPVWVAVGGTTRSVIRAGTLGLPMALAIIGGTPARFRGLVDLYREAAREAGHESRSMPLGINSHMWLADDSRRAADEFFPPYAEVMTRIGLERGWPTTTREQYEMLRSPQGALAVGTPDEVIEKILAMHRIFGHQRHLAQLTVGPMPHDKVLHAIELLGTVVAPAVKREAGNSGRRPRVSAVGDKADRAVALAPPHREILGEER